MQLSNSCADNTMEIQPDFRDLLALLNEHQVDYLIVGAYALAFQGSPRYTGDIDIFVRPESGNAVHKGNIYLGLVALDENRRDDSETHLRKAGEHSCRRLVAVSEALPDFCGPD